MGIYVKEKDKVILICRAFGPSFKIRVALKNKIKLRCMHLHPHAKRRLY